ncbi:MAG TPA: sensor histidine kinase, partial [Hyphomicrobium sp.]|nr:sensor histidine kinase [Hyphomicrobium sp.]
MRSRITHRIAVRLASFVALIVTLTNIAIFAALYFTISAQMMGQLRAHINEVRKTLADIEANDKGGLHELAAMVDGHGRVAQSDEDIYLLV